MKKQMEHFQILWIYPAHRGKTKGDWVNYLSITFKQTSHICYCETLTMCHCFTALTVSVNGTLAKAGQE